MSKINSIDEREERLKNQLNDLMMGITSQSSNSSSVETKKDDIDIFTLPKTDLATEISKSDEPQVPAAPAIDMIDLDKRFKTQARNIINSMYDFYFNFGVIDKPEYLKQKNNLETINVSTMLLQLKTSKMVLGTILNEINAGNTNPKVIDAFVNLNGQISALTRDQANYMIFLEESCKKAKIEAMDYNLMKNTQKEKQAIVIEQKIEDVNPIQEEQPKTNEHDEKFFLTSDPLILIEEINKCDMTDEEIREQRSDYLKERGDVSRYVNYANKNDLVEEYDVDAATIKADDEMDDDSDLLSMI